MSLAKKKLFKNGFIQWNTGKSPSEETKTKISISLKGRFVGKDHPFYGKKHTEESKRKCIEASKRRKGTHHSGQKGKILKIDKETLKILGVYSSAPAAAETLSIKGTIQTAGNRICESIKRGWCAYGFKWAFEKDFRPL